MIDVLFLGTGGGMPMPNRFLSSVLISYKGKRILLDCGEGTQVAMRKYRTGFKALDIILISHYHGDHIFGLPGLLSTMGNSGRTEPVTLIGPMGLGRIVGGLLLALPKLAFDLKIIENPGEDLAFNFSKDEIEIVKGDPSCQNSDLILSTIKLDHSSPCLGYSLYASRRPEFLPDKAESYGLPKKYWRQLQNGKPIDYQDRTFTPSMVMGEDRRGLKLTYITDTRPVDSIVGFIEDSDLFICEGTYGDEEDREKAVMNKHMTFSEAAGLAYRGRVKKLILTHFSTALEEPALYKENARGIFSESLLAHDGFKDNLNWE